MSISQETEADQPWAMVRVQDHGVGIPAADLPHIFERFRRGGNVVGRIPGTGVGLASPHQQPVSRTWTGGAPVRSQAACWRKLVELFFPADARI